MSTAFQGDAFQTAALAFQIDVGPSPAAVAAPLWVEPKRGPTFVADTRGNLWS